MIITLLNFAMGVGHFSEYGRQVPFIPERAAQQDSFYQMFHLNGLVVFIVCAILIAMLIIGYFWEPIKKLLKISK